MSEDSHLLRARWVFPVAGPPIEDGLVEIIDGRIARLDSRADADAVDLGPVAIIPGLVNAHTHLEFSHLDQPLTPPTPFPDWIRAVIKARQTCSRPVREVIHAGLRESAASGSTHLGEIATSDVSPLCASADTPRVTAFLEVLALDDEGILRQCEAMDRFLFSEYQDEKSHVQRGLSPHAPYSVAPELFRRVIATAIDSEAPVAMHLAETPDELELLDRQTGPLVEMLRSLGVWRAGLFERGTSVLSFLESLAELSRVLVVHGNYLSDEEIAFLTNRSQFSVVYCPRTHAFFGHRDHPWQTLLERGVNVALGTDSRASNPDLNVWNEVLFLRQRFPSVSGETLLRMATINGASALGLAEESGILAPGRSADLAVVQLDGDAINDANDPHDGLIGTASRIVAVMRAGRWISA